MAEYSDYQKDVIRRYYENRDQIDRERLGELVTSLFLEQGGKKSRKMWESAAELMRRLEVPESRIEHVVGTGDPAVLAEVVQDLETGRL